MNSYYSATLTRAQIQAQNYDDVRRGDANVRSLVNRLRHQREMVKQAMTQTHSTGAVPYTIAPSSNSVYLSTQQK